MVKQIISNLVSNALKYTPRGGSVTVALGLSSNGGARIQVSDTGVGIKPEHIPSAFAAFVQIENSMTKSTNPGTGLGLALTKRFTELHGGKIKLASREGEGTTVTVTLPSERSVARPNSAEIVSLDRRADGGAARRHQHD